MSKFKKFFGVAAVAAVAAGVIAYFMKKDRPVEAEFETPDDEEDFEQDLKDLFDDGKEEPAVHVVTNETEKPSEEAAAEEPEAEKPSEETAAPVSAEETSDSSQEEKEAPELEKPEETAQEETIAVEAPASQEE